MDKERQMELVVVCGAEEGYMARDYRKTTICYPHIRPGFVEGSRSSFCPPVTTVPPRSSPPNISNSFYLVILP